MYLRLNPGYLRRFMGSRGPIMPQSRGSTMAMMVLGITPAEVTDETGPMLEPVTVSMQSPIATDLDLDIKSGVSHPINPYGALGAEVDANGGRDLLSPDTMPPSPRCAVPSEELTWGFGSLANTPTAANSPGISRNSLSSLNFPSVDITTEAHTDSLHGLQPEPTPDSARGSTPTLEPLSEVTKSKAALPDVQPTIIEKPQTPSPQSKKSPSPSDLDDAPSNVSSIEGASSTSTPSTSVRSLRVAESKHHSRSPRNHAGKKQASPYHAARALTIEKSARAPLSPVQLNTTTVTSPVKASFVSNRKETVVVPVSPGLSPDKRAIEAAKWTDKEINKLIVEIQSRGKPGQNVRANYLFKL